MYDRFTERNITDAVVVGISMDGSSIDVCGRYRIVTESGVMPRVRPRKKTIVGVPLPRDERKGNQK